MAKQPVALISLTLEQHARLKAIAERDKRTMRAVIDLMLDLYEGK